MTSPVQHEEYLPEDIAAVPRGWEVSTIAVANPRQGKHLVQVAYPPGRGRQRNRSGKLVSVLHPATENPRCRRNPEDWESDALEISPDAPDALALEDWRGSSAKEVLEFQDRQFQDPRDFYTIGQLCGLWTGAVPYGATTEEATQKELRAWDQVVPRLCWDEPYTVLLAADAHDTTEQLYLISDPGEQVVPEPVVEQMCRRAGVEYKPAAQYQSLGTCYGVGYEAKKIFDGHQKMRYFHAFGEEDGQRPVLWYDRRRRGLVLTGGNYRIDRKDAELGASPGIAN